MAREYETLNDALNAVDKEVSAQSVKIEDILSALEVKAGGSLPSGIKKIAGGEFVFAEDMYCDKHYIEHGLGEKPKGFLIITNDFERIAAGVRTMLMIVGIRRTVLKQDGSVSSLGSDYMSFFNADGTPYPTQSFNYTTELQIDREYSENTIRFYYDSAVYHGGSKYKWYAWV